MSFKGFIYKHKASIIFFCLFVVLIGVFAVYFNKNNSSTNENMISYDFSTYLKKDTEFNRNISTILPSAETLRSQKVVYYLFYDNGDDSETFGERILNITIEYTDNAFEGAIVDIESKRAQYNIEINGTPFYYKGVLYKGIMFTNEGYCAIAYHICKESKTISYIAFDRMELSFMSIEDTLKLFSNIV